MVQGEMAKTKPKDGLVAVSIRLKQETYDMLKSAADAAHRSINGEITFRLEQGMVIKGPPGVKKR